MIELLVIVWVVGGLFAARLGFKMMRSIVPSKDLFSSEEITAWNRKWLPTDLLVGLLSFLMGPFGIVLPLVFPQKEE